MKNVNGKVSGAYDTRCRGWYKLSVEEKDKVHMLSYPDLRKGGIDISFCRYTALKPSLGKQQSDDRSNDSVVSVDINVYWSIYSVILDQAIQNHNFIINSEPKKTFDKELNEEVYDFDIIKHSNLT